MGGAGLATTIDDYMRFARMLLNHGTLDGVRILKPSTVRLMTTDQLDPKITERGWLPTKGNGGFGFDFFVRTGQPKDAGGKSRARSANSSGTAPGRHCSGSIPPTT